MSNEDYNKFIDDTMGDDNAELTPEQAAQMLEMAMGNGDTAKAESIEPPADTADTEDKPAAEVEDKPEDINEANSVLMARDGLHTIPFEQLLEARQQATVTKTQLDEANKELEELRQWKQSQDKSDNPTTQQDKDIETAQAAIDAGIDPSIFGDFDEEGIASGIQKLIAEQMKSALAPVNQKQEEDALASHWKTIFDSHADADSALSSVEFKNWADSQPSYAQSSINTVLEQGTASQLVELLDNFKGSSNSNQSKGIDPEVLAADARAKAKAVIDGTKKSVPVSLSDMPGRPGAVAIGEQVKEMSGIDALDVMSGWTKEQIDRHLNSI